MTKNQKLKTIVGLTLIEVIIYVGIFAVIGGLMTAILLNATRIEERETAGAEVVSQLNFVSQTIQRLIRESSNIEITAGLATSTLKLRMKDAAKDPTYISFSGNTIELKEGSSAATALTSDRVVVNALNFKKFTQYPGHDTVSFDIAMTSKSQTPTGKVERTITSAVTRASAATFDSDVLPGTGYNFNLGQSGAPWQNIYLSGVLNIGAAASDPPGQNGSIYYNTVSDVFRGYSNGSWVNLGGSGPWTVSGNNIYNTNTGSVGIGTASPGAKLDVAGAIKIGGGWVGSSVNAGAVSHRSASCSAAERGNVRVSDVANNYDHLCYCGLVGVGTYEWRCFQ